MCTCTFDLHAKISFPRRASASQLPAHSTAVEEWRKAGTQLCSTFRALTATSLPWPNKDTALVHCWHCPVHLQVEVSTILMQNTLQRVQARLTPGLEFSESFSLGHSVCATLPLSLVRSSLPPQPFSFTSLTKQQTIACHRMFFTWTDFSYYYYKSFRKQMSQFWKNNQEHWSWRVRTALQSAALSWQYGISPPEHSRN